jgi:site-specific DNA recombinase
VRSTSPEARVERVAVQASLPTSDHSRSNAVQGKLFPAEQARIMKLLVERVDVQVDGLEVRLRAEGLASLVIELQQQPVAEKAG